MKIVSIVGARPQFVKCAPVSREIRKNITEILVHTGQHYDAGMSQVFFDELNIPLPDYNLGVGSGSQGAQTGKMLIKIEEVLEAEQPDMVLVYGDTNSTVAGALAASKLHIPVAHVEAGLRSYDKQMPEEINRICTDHISDLLFCPTKTSVENLREEGITEGVHFVGDVMVDALRYNINIARERSNILQTLSVKSGEYLVATVHRQSNTDSEQNLRNIIEAFSRSDETVIFPAHPRTVKYLENYGLLSHLPENVRLIEPVSYLDMLNLLSNAKKVLTDSGGVQKEANILQVPCVTLRENTEWIETIEDGWNTLVGTDVDKIIEAVKKPLPPEITPSTWFGEGDASEKIHRIIENYSP